MPFMLPQAVMTRCHKKHLPRTELPSRLLVHCHKLEVWHCIESADANQLSTATMPTTRSATKKQTKLDDFETDEVSKTKSTAKKQKGRAGNHDDTATSSKSEQPPKQQTTRSNEAMNPKKPDSALERGKAKVERARGAPKSPQPPKPNSSAKRKAHAADDNNNNDAEQQPYKKSRSDGSNTKQAHFSGDSTTDLEKPIMINRSPVLQLWGAVVADFLHPDESWETCLSIGGAIATLCAISKGRAIGQVAPKDESTEAENKRKKRKQETKKESREIEVMGFPQQIKGDVVVVDGKPKPLKEGLLQGKFGGESNYEKVKKAMEDGLQSWKDDKDELDKKAFHMYEKFRPDVAAGGSGWGRKGELNLHKVKSKIER